jgi:hypothetical protein
LEQVRALPGVEAVGMGNPLPLGGSLGLSIIEFERIDQELAVCGPNILSSLVV